MKPYNIYTDGSCKGNPGKGGWAYIIERNNKVLFSGSGYVGETTTNNRMELFAAIMGLSVLQPGKHDIVIISDSQYVIGMINNFNKNTKYDLARKTNGDLLVLLSNEYYRFILHGDVVSTLWVKGHSGNKYNELVDKMAREKSS